MYSIAKRYAQALFEASQEADQGEYVQKDLKKILQRIDDTREFEEFLENPAIPAHVRQSIIDQIFKKSACELCYRFIRFLEHKKRLNLLKGICRAFESLYLENKGVRQITVASAVTLTEHQIKELSSHLKLRLKKDVELFARVDPAMLAGIRIYDGDTIYDYSAKTMLEQFRKNFIKA